MAKTTVDIEASKLAKNITITVRVKGLQAWIWRFRIGAWFIRLGVWIAGLNYEGEITEQ